MNSKMNSIIDFYGGVGEFDRQRYFDLTNGTEIDYLKTMEAYRKAKKQETLAWIRKKVARS